MAVRIPVENHIPELVRLYDAGFGDVVETLKCRLARLHPVADLTRRTIDGAIEKLEQTSPEPGIRIAVISVAD